jgi:hypothetical protein
MHGLVARWEYEILDLLERQTLRVETCFGDGCADRIMFVQEGENEWQGFCHSHGMTLRLIDSSVH